MIASLPMYDRPEAVPANDRLWARIRDELAGQGIDAPEALDRTTDIFETWTHADLLLSQSCSLPFRAMLAGRVSIVGAPDIRLNGCPAGYYCSVLVARAGDRRREFADFGGAVLAYNDRLSQSGWVAPMQEAARCGISFSGFTRTSSHEASSVAVADGRADIAAIDAHSWRLIRRFDTAAAGLREVSRTGCTPGLPLITACKELVPVLFEAVRSAILLTPASDLELIPFRGLVQVPEAEYLALPDAMPVPD